jgi:regulator of protease activity HflC (stomatin/prohibitin superfamily)
MGASRRQHHRRVQAERDAAKVIADMEAQQLAAQRVYQAQIEAMRAQAEALTPDKPPRPIQSTLEASRTGVRTARSTRGTVRGLSKGLAQLRIPLNIGGNTGSGLNIG